MCNHFGAIPTYFIINLTGFTSEISDIISSNTPSCLVTCHKNYNINNKNFTDEIKDANNRSLFLQDLYVNVSMMIPASET